MQLPERKSARSWHHNDGYAQEDPVYEDIENVYEDLQDELNNPDRGYSSKADGSNENKNSEASSSERHNIYGDTDGPTLANFSGMTEYFNKYEQTCRDETEPVIDHDATNENAFQSPTSNYYHRTVLGIKECQQAPITEYANHTEVQDETPAEFPPPVDGVPCIFTDQAPVTNYYTIDCEKQLDKREDQKHEDKSGITDYESPPANQEAPGQEAGDEDDIYGDVAEDDYEQIK